MIAYEFLQAISVAIIAIMFIIGFIFSEKETDYWVLFAWVICFLVGLFIGEYIVDQI